MSKQANEPRTADNEARAYAKYLRTRPQKLNIVAAMIRGKSAEKALVDLQFSRRRIAAEVRKVLASAVANAENNHSLNVDRLVVAEASVGKTMSMKRFHARGRGRASRVEKPFSNLTIIVREESDADKAKKEAKKAAKAAKKPAAVKDGANETKKAAPKKAAAKAKKEA
jgi:large subunit ribosomal protein L22